jgi:hypothetical protein
MSLLSMICAQHQIKKGPWRTAAWVLYVLLFVLAIFLAIKDINLLSHTTTKLFVLALAVLIPELYVILHGISSSSMGVSFFTGSPIESRMLQGWGGDGGVKSKLGADVELPSPSETSSSLF